MKETLKQHWLTILITVCCTSLAVYVVVMGVIIFTAPKTVVAENTTQSKQQSLPGSASTTANAPIPPKVPPVKTETPPVPKITPTETVAPAQTDLRIKGNRRSMIYHMVGCPNYNQISPDNVVWFKTEEEAKAAGYRRSGNC